jgi:nitrate/TMAO reductase-like tetraheme cytochrome c subunit
MTSGKEVRMRKLFLLFFGICFFGMFSILCAGEGEVEVKEEVEKEVAEPKYMGVAKCKTCHKMEKRGDQYTKWLESKHAKAFETLASEKAMEFAKAKGIEDPQKNEACVKCHVTAYGLDASRYGEKYTMEEGVGCETCHGPGEFYAKASLKSPKKWREDPEGMHEKLVKAGLIAPTAETCIQCHNDESPAYKEFKFEEFSAMIAHPKPEVVEEKTK